MKHIVLHLLISVWCCIHLVWIHGLLAEMYVAPSLQKFTLMQRCECDQLTMASSSVVALEVFLGSSGGTGGLTLHL